MKFSKFLFVYLIAGLILFGLPFDVRPEEGIAAITMPGEPEEGIAAITMPSGDVTLSFVQPGLIAEVYVKEGDMVTAEQVLIRQDDAAEQAQLALMREQSRDITQVEAQKASLGQKRSYLEKLEWAAERGSATEMELQDAKLEVEIAEFSLKSAEFEHEQNIRKYEESKIRVENMELKSPISGKVEKVDVEVGESIDRMAGVVRAVKTDPLWIDVHLPLQKGKTLRLDQEAKVIFQGDPENVAEGKVIFISTVADAASATLRARIEVPNKSYRPAGEHVSVLF